MTALQIDKALTQIVIDKYNKCETKLKSIDKELKTERKAIQIELGMYGLCLRAGLLYYTTGTRESTLKHFLGQANKIFSSFSKISQAFETASENEKLTMVAALRQEAFMREQFSNKNESAYEIAKREKLVDDSFELNIKVEAINAVYRAWEQWRKENGIYPDMF